MLSERVKQVVSKHLKREKTDWKEFQASFENAWVEDLTRAGVISSVEDCQDGIQQVRHIEPFVVELFRYDPDLKDSLNKPLGRANSLVLFARRRLRAKYHLFITTQKKFGFTPASNLDRKHATMVSDNPWLTEGALLDAIRMACGVDYVVALSSPEAGASVYGLHFQAMPRFFRHGDESHELFAWLEQFVPTRSGNYTTYLQGYPAVCVTVCGTQKYVQENVWHLAKGYNDLSAYNLIIRGLTQQHAAAYFFPRPFSTEWEGPLSTAQHNWAFGSFEMGGLFLVPKEEAFQTYCRRRYKRVCHPHSIPSRKPAYRSALRKESVWKH